MILFIKLHDITNSITLLLAEEFSSFYTKSDSSIQLNQSLLTYLIQISKLIWNTFKDLIYLKNSIFVIQIAYD